MSGLSIQLPPELVEEIARRVAEILRDESPPAARDEWLSLDAAADRVGCSSKTLSRAIDRGDLPASRATGRPRVAAADLEAWMRGGLGTPAPAAHSSPRRPRQPSGGFRALAKDDRREKGRRRR